jgi:hypothetical protein
VCTHVYEHADPVQGNFFQVKETKITKNSKGDWTLVEIQTFAEKAPGVRNQVTVPLRV